MSSDISRTFSENIKNINGAVEVMPLQEPLTSYHTFDDQIGGHLKIKDVTCMVADKDGHLLKYVEESERGRNEQKFYSTIFSDHNFTPLRDFVPKYYGLVGIVKDDELLTYLKIENLLHGFDDPNIIDIKIGKVTHDPYASKEKMKREFTKYPAQREIGFRLSGMKVYNGNTKSYDCYSGSLFRACKCFSSPKEKTLRYLKKFLGFYGNGIDNFHNNHDNNIRNGCSKCCKWFQMLATIHLIEHIIEDLEAILYYMKKQRRVNLYASSLLIAYDSNKLYSSGKCCLHKEKWTPSPASITSLYSTKQNVHGANHLCSLDSLQNDFVENFKNGNGTKKEVGTKQLMEFVRNNFVASHMDDNCDLRDISHTCDKEMSVEPDILKLHIPYVVRMIDFGHTFLDLNPGNEVDENYLFGTESLREYFQNILKEICHDFFGKYSSD